MKEIDEKESKKKQPKMIELKELEKRIDSIKKSHELELKNIETMAKFMAVEFFNKKRRGNKSFIQQWSNGNLQSIWWDPNKILLQWKKISLASKDNFKLRKNNN